MGGMYDSLGVAHTQTGLQLCTLILKSERLFGTGNPSQEFPLTPCLPSKCEVVVAVWGVSKYDSLGGKSPSNVGFG